MEEESDFRQKKITIIGLGLIGGSLGLALKKYNPAFKITGIDKPNIMEKALYRGAVDKIQPNLSTGIKDADIVIIATPVKTIIRLFSKIKPFLKKSCLVTDTGSTKAEIMKEAEKVFSDDIDFIGGHPIAGLENSGIEYATAELFRGKPYLMVPQKENKRRPQQKLSHLVNSIGAREISIDASEHDQILAIISHLPQLIAITLTNILGLWVKEKNKKDLFKISGKTFQEMTRVADSPFDIWSDIYETNSDNTVYFLEEFGKWLDQTKEKIRTNPMELEEYFCSARLFKEKMLNR